MAIHFRSISRIERFSTATGALFLATASLLFVNPVDAETRITSDYIAIDVEGEDLDNGDVRWTLTEANTPQTVDDPDPNHSSDAAGNSYLELLPDIRVTHDDPFGPPTAFWGNGGQGPDLNYTVDFPEAGRYFVHVRALSTGSEDNGIHVGLNSEYPSHGLRMQWCSAREGWTWSSAQRGDETMPCGTEKTIWIEVPSEGEHTVNFSAREDGFEFDRFMLIKDLSSNTRICEPTLLNTVSCIDGSLSEADDRVDLVVELETDRTAGVVFDEFTFTATVENVDLEDTAENVTLTFDIGLDNQWLISGIPDSCQNTGSTVECELGSVEPKRTSGSLVYVLTAQAVVIGDNTISATVASSNFDEVSDNNSDSLELNIEQQVIYTELNSEFNAPETSVHEREEFTFSAMVENTGEHPAVALVVSLEFPEEIQVSESPDSCSGDLGLLCELEELAVGDVYSLSFTLSSDQAGLYPLRANVVYENSEESAQEFTDFVSVTPIDDVIVEGTNSSDETSEPSETNVDAGLARGGASGYMFLLALLGFVGLRLRSFIVPRLLYVVMPDELTFQKRAK